MSRRADRADGDSPRAGFSRSLTFRLSLVLGILVAVCTWFTVGELADASRASRIGADVETFTERLSALRDLESALGSMRGFSIAIEYSISIGVTPEVVTNVLGIDLIADLETARADAVDAIDRLGDASPVADIPTGGPELLTPLTEETRRQRLATMDALRILTADGDDVARLQRATDRLALAIELAPALGEQSFSTANLLLDETGATTSTRLGNAVRDQAYARTLLEQLLEHDDETAASVRDLVTTAEYVELDELTTESIAARIDGDVRDLSLLELTALGGVWKGAQETHARALEASDVAVAELNRAGAALERSADASRQRAIGIVALALLAVTVALVWFLRSVVRPLRMLESDARRLAQGETPDAPMDYGGARELRATGQAIGQLVDSLTLIERQADALADGDIDAPVLQRTAPGRLGDAIAGTVRRLSSSIAEQHELRARLEYEATHDGLTGIANRRAAFAYLAERSAGHESTTAISIDLDGFKQVNDRFGHSVGDELLCAVADGLSDLASDSDLAVRIGGDEFLVLLGRAVDDDAVDAIEREVVARVEASRIAVHPASGVQVSASVGIATFGPDDNVDDALRRADQAMYRAKDRGTRAAPRHA